MQTPIYGALPLTLKLQPGTLFWLKSAAGELSLTPAQYAQNCFHLIPDARGIPRLAVRAPSRANIAVTGTCGSVVGTLEEIMSGNVSIDEPDEATPRRLAARRQPIIVDHTELERDESGNLTGRLSPKRIQRRPGRRRAVQAERARTYLAQRPDLTGDA